MTTDLEPFTGHALPVAPPASMAERLNDHVAALHAAQEIAGLIHKSVRAYDGGLEKDGKRRAGRDEATVAIYHGQLIGFDPIQSLQNIIVVHGTPSMYARAMKALLLQHGHQVETVVTNERIATVRAKHRRSEVWEEVTWTIERARKAGYTSNAKYNTDPEGMLYARALADACKRAAPDVLLGLANADDDYEADSKPVRVTSERVGPADALDPRPTGPVVQQWEPPAGEPDAADSSTPAAEETEPASATEEMSNSTQQRRLSKLLDDHGVTDAAAKRGYLSDQFHRTIKSARELTAAEACQLIVYLESPIDSAATAEMDDRAVAAAEIVHAEQSNAEGEGADQ
jgi:hypothetical protein